MPSNTSSDRRARTPLRLGVIGLGRLWDVRHKPSVAALGDRFRVAAVYDQVARRAELEAAQLGCDASESLRTLLHRDDLDAILLTAPQWFGLHALRLTREAGKPVYCALNAAENPEDFERLAIEKRERSPE